MKKFSACASAMLAVTALLGACGAAAYGSDAKRVAEARVRATLVGRNQPAFH